MEEKLDKKTNWVNVDYEGIKSIRKEVEEVYGRYLGSVKPIEERYSSRQQVPIVNFL